MTINNIVSKSDCLRTILESYILLNKENLNSVVNIKFLTD